MQSCFHLTVGYDQSCQGHHRTQKARRAAFLCMTPFPSSCFWLADLAVVGTSHLLQLVLNVAMRKKPLYHIVLPHDLTEYSHLHQQASLHEQTMTSAVGTGSEKEGKFTQTQGCRGIGSSASLK